MDRERRIGARAYAIWEREGRPEGRDREHWDRATREIDAEGDDPAGTDGRKGSPALATVAAGGAGGVPVPPRGRRGTSAPAPGPDDAPATGTPPRASRARRMRAAAD